MTITPHSPLLTPHPSLPTHHSSLLTHHSSLQRVPTVFPRNGTTGMFHGPAFQSVSSVERCGENGLEARVRVPRGVRLFRSVEEPCFLAHPVLLDAAGQTVGFWAADRLDKGFVVFPAGFESLQFFGEGGAPFVEGQTGLGCRTRIRSISDRRILSDMELVNGRGEPVLRIEGWEDQRFDFARSFVAFILSPGEEMLSEPWIPENGLPGAPGVSGLSEFCGCRLDPSRVMALGMRDALWTEVIARSVLTSRELGMWRRMADSRKEGRSWLLSRMVCKDAVRRLLKDRYQWLLAPADVEIGSDGYGRQALVGLLADMIEEPILTFTAEKDGIALAIAGPATAHLQKGG